LAPCFAITGKFFSA